VTPGDVRNPRTLPSSLRSTVMIVFAQKRVPSCARAIILDAPVRHAV
jgi:hypothetical protein